MPTMATTVSSQSRRKLKAFEYQKHESDTMGAGPVNNNYIVENQPVRTTDTRPRRDDQQQSSPFPHTPGSKIAFADLIANPEDALSRVINATPNEQVEWEHIPGSSNKSMSSRTSKRGRKRPRSTSPVSSSQGQHSKHFEVDKEPLNLDSISKSLRTPNKDDPAVLLWDKYVDKHEKGDHTEPILPPLPPMSSSPNTPNSLNKAESLRRTASCGVEWPVSTTKRRKIAQGDPHGRTKGIFAANKHAILRLDQSKNSRVSILVDSIHQSLVQNPSIEEEESPSSSSPIPERQSDFYVGRPDNSHTEASVPITGGVQSSPVVKPNNTNDKSSDFSDMDFDADDPDLINALELATQARPILGQDQIAEQIQERSQKKIPAEKRSREPSDLVAGSIKSDSPALNAPIAEASARISKPCSETKLPEQLDDFDDDDDLMTELAELTYQVESQGPTTLGKAENVLPQLNSQLDGINDSCFLDDDDDLNEEIWKEFDSSAVQKFPAVTAISKNSTDHRTIKRYLVFEVFETSYKDAQGRRRPEKMVSIKDERAQHMYIILLRQSWYDTRCTKGSYVHLVGDFDLQGNCIVDDNDNMIILHPDHLISATVVADSFTCTRRAVLQDRIKATNPPEAPQVYGHLIHEVFGEALKANDWDMRTLRSIVEKLLPTYIESLYEIGVQPQDATEYVMSKMPELKGWASIFVNADLVPEAKIRDRNGVLVPMSINKLLEVEEHVWSPMYGLKGNIDATVQTRMQLPSDAIARTLTVPLELKTGKRDSNEMHRAQTALYTLLLTDRYDVNVTCGILYYLETAKTFRVVGVRNEIRHMIIQRNELACYVHDKLALPPMIQKQHLCKKCYAQTSCFTYHKLVEGGDAESSGMSQVFNERVGHLNQSQQAFFKKWDDLLTKEERDSMKFRRELWTMLSTEREAVGRCFSNVIIEPGSAVEHPSNPKINRFSYSLTKQKPSPGFSFAESQITVGEPIVVSDEQGHFALANGYVTNIRPSRITIAVDRRLQNVRKKQNGFHPEFNQTFSGIMEVGNRDNTPAATDNSAPTLYRIDKDEFANGMATARNNILRIMEKDLFRAKELRQLIVENKKPTFKVASTGYTLSGPASQQSINMDQRQAIEKVMSARDYALVLGMPGTGKTTTIAHIIRALVSQGKSVLLTSYTHTAVDNILLKIKDDNIPILRLGAVGKVHPEVQQFADLSGIPKTSIAELEKSWSTSKVVATTCLGINHAIFNHRKFDFCIVDEASQITLPVCLGPIRLASTFILVGDHYQLPPLVQNKEAQEQGLDISLFKLLSDAQPSSVVSLEHQYRMAEDIMVFSNSLVYHGRLKCGNAAVASRLLQIPNLEAGLEAHHVSSAAMLHHSPASKHCVLTPSNACWLRESLRPQNRSVFLNTDSCSGDYAGLGAPERLSRSGTRITNPVEATISAQLVTTLVRAGIAPKSIGVITFYRSQLALLKTTVKAMAGTTAAIDIEMHTADKYQGRDKETIILSCVRSNDSGNVGELLKDWRRVNVALTRAKSKLIIIGSSRTLEASDVDVLKGMVKIANQRRFTINLPANAIGCHLFEGSETQSQTQPRTTSVKPRHLEGGDVTPLKKADQRVPLGSSNGNTSKRKPDQDKRIPAKVVHGTLGADKILNKNPIMRNIADELFGIVEID